MTTPTGSISMLDIIEELDGTRTPRPISLNDTDVRKLAGKPSGAIRMNDLRGKSKSYLIFNITVGQGTLGNSPIYGVKYGIGSVSIVETSGVLAGALVGSAYTTENSTGDFSVTLAGVSGILTNIFDKLHISGNGRDETAQLYDAVYATSDTILSRIALGFLSASDVGKTYQITLVSL